MAIKDVKLNGNTLPIREFQLDWMCDNPSICMIAKRGSGKSWVCRCILKHFRDIPGGAIIARTDKMNPFYGEFFPELYIHYEYSSDILESILYRQDRIKKKAKDKAKLGKKIDTRAFLVMDDCLSNKKSWMKDQPIMEIFFNGRHYDLMYILTMQYPLGLGPELRSNFDYIFLLAEDFYTNQKRLYDHYVGMFPNFKAFREVFLQITDNFGSMVVSNRGARSSFLDKVFWYKATNEKIDHIGCKQFNNFHKDNYDDQWEERDKVFDITKYVNDKKNSGGSIVVSKVH